MFNSGASVEQVCCITVEILIYQLDIVNHFLLVIQLERPLGMDAICILKAGGSGTNTGTGITGGPSQR